MRTSGEKKQTVLASPICIEQTQGHEDKCLKEAAKIDCYRIGDTECSSACMGFLKEVAVIFITSTIVWSQIKQQGGNTAPAINIKLD